VGCGVLAAAQKGGEVSVRGDPAHPANRGVNERITGYHREGLAHELTDGASERFAALLRTCAQEISFGNDADVFGTNFRFGALRQLYKQG